MLTQEPVLLLVILFPFFLTCTLDNKKGGTYIYNVIENQTNRKVAIYTYEDSVFLDSLVISPFATRRDTSYYGNGEQDSYTPLYLGADAATLRFGQERIINYSVTYTPEPEYNLVNGKNFLGVGWQEESSYSERKFTYSYVVFRITEQDFAAADTL